MLAEVSAAIRVAARTAFNLLAGVPARDGGVATAFVSAGADRARAGGGHLVQDAAAVRAAVYAEPNVVLCDAVRGGAVASAAVYVELLVQAAAVMHAAAHTALSIIPRVTVPIS